jgi:hypothetical protein
MGKIRTRNTVFIIVKVRILDQVWESYRTADGAWSVPPAGVRPPGAAPHRQQQQHQARVTHLLLIICCALSLLGAYPAIYNTFRLDFGTVVWSMYSMAPSGRMYETLG